jgi:hypothetical protein
MAGDSVQVSDPVDGLVAPVRATVPGGADPGVYVRVVSGGGLAAGNTLAYVPVNQGAPGTTALVAADPTRKNKVLGAVLTLSATGTLKFTDGVGDLTGPMDISATGGFVLPASLIPFTETAAINRALSLVTTGGAARGVVLVLIEA